MKTQEEIKDMLDTLVNKQYKFNSISKQFDIKGKIDALRWVLKEGYEI